MIYCTKDVPRKGKKRKGKKHTHDETPLTDLGIPNHLVQSIGTLINLSKQSSILKLLSNRIGIISIFHSHRNDHDLFWVEPEWPFTSEILCDDGDESFEGT